MDIKQCSEKFNVSEDLLQTFIEAGIAEDYSLLADRDFDSEAVQQRLSFCVCLYSIGLDIPDIKDYIRLEESKENSAEERITILRQARENALNSMHEAKDVLECIDGMLKELKLSKEKNGIHS